MRNLARDEGVGVLWTTHLVDEIGPGDHVVILHRGKLRADATCAEIVAQAGAVGIGEAFTGLTGAGATSEEADA